MKDFYHGKCVTCRFWDPLHDVSKYEGPSLETVLGWCKQDPSRQLDTGGVNMDQYPLTASIDQCGQWEEKRKVVG
jgi:hypothetical protein